MPRKSAKKPRKATSRKKAASKTTRKSTGRKAPGKKRVTRKTTRRAAERDRKPASRSRKNRVNSSRRNRRTSRKSRRSAPSQAVARLVAYDEDGTSYHITNLWEGKSETTLYSGGSTLEYMEDFAELMGAIEEGEKVNFVIFEITDDDGDIEEEEEEGDDDDNDEVPF